MVVVLAIMVVIIVMVIMVVIIMVMIMVVVIMVMIIMVMIMEVVIMVVITNIVSTVTYDAWCVNVILGRVRGPNIIILVTLVNIKVVHKVFRILMQRLVVRW